MKHAAKASSTGPLPTVMEHLRRNSAADQLLPTAERFLEIQQDLRLLLPASILEGCSVCHFDADSLTLGVASASVASKLRQTLPRLREGLVRRGWKVNAISVRVQPDHFAEKSESYPILPKRAKVPESALAHLSGLADQLEESPLRRALETLLKRQRPPSR